MVVAKSKTKLKKTLETLEVARFNIRKGDIKSLL